ncbi:cytochrome P450, partial [Trifolium medium]|nr:cytochrome P450 [Trifolium medium]
VDLVTHLQYADDTLLICELCVENLWTMKAVLRWFELMPGLKINFGKSKLFRVNLEQGFLNVAARQGSGVGAIGWWSCCSESWGMKALDLGVWDGGRWNWVFEWRRVLFVWEEKLFANLVDILEPVRLFPFVEDSWCCRDIDGEKIGKSIGELRSFKNICVYFTTPFWEASNEIESCQKGSVGEWGGS